ncbi:hypothetical protein Tdes44962_MAKER09184 [Teratosphaeria destructans]|uniref:Uncharacterized protein n=1 Tax=Teratosphaeria destructans TaxID=418781 RepID=A0A9W7SUI1_9PEZI|nr:hypothetical protein Tdes44962_MAKER09184 [Teratosphaeria destructans]
MSGLMDKVKDKANQALDKKSQPGNKVESTADNDANTQINNLANDAGVPQQDDQLIDKVADAKVNSDIPFGNK